MVLCWKRIDKVEPTKENNTKEFKTDWLPIYLCTAFTFFDGVYFSMFFVSMWPYLNTIDPGTSPTFYGIITASFSFGQAVSSPFFGFWMNKAKAAKPPLIASILLMVVSNIMYISLEIFHQHNRRYIMLASRILMGIAAGGDMVVTRAYSASSALPKDRPRAVILSAAAFTFGLTLGPALAVVFSPIGYPGLNITDKLHIDMYNSPAWISVIINFVSIILIYTIFKENDKNKSSEKTQLETSSISEPKLNTIGVGLCIFSAFTMMFIFTNNETIGSLFSMTMYDWSNSEALKYYGLIQLGEGGVDFLLNIVFIWIGPILSKKNLERQTAMTGLALMLTFFILTFPWSFWDKKLTYSIINIDQNSTDITGCYTSKFDWCSNTSQVPLWLYIFCTLAFMAASLAFGFLAVNTLFSKILGNKRQGTMTGFLFMGGSFARTIGPLIVSFVFDLYGPKIVWAIDIGLLIFTILLWFIFYRKMDPMASNSDSN